MKNPRVWKPEDLDVVVLRRLVPQMDGHSIIRPSFFKGLNPDFVASLTNTYKSDTSSPKSTIFTDAGPVNQLQGVYALDFLYRVAEILGVRSSSGADAYFGRGRQAGALQQAIMDKIGRE
jgi:hypothetical protein